VTIIGIRKSRGGAAMHEKDYDINHIFTEAKSLSGKAERHQSGHELSLMADCRSWAVST
jgi:hypothetical protein